MAIPLLKCNIFNWNVRGAMSSAGSLSKLLDDFDVDLAFISEHKLREQHKSFLESIHNNYTSICTCNSSVVTGARCGKGGVAVMFRKNCQFSISTLDIPLNDRITGIKICQSKMRPIYAFSVYMPSVNYNVSDYLECFESLQDIHDTFVELGTVMFFGDFNCDTNSPTSNNPRVLKFKSFLAHTNVTLTPLEGDYTFRPTHKILDYVMISHNDSDLVISNKTVENELTTVSDHLPIYTVLQCNLNVHEMPHKNFIAWNKCSEDNLNLYRYSLEQELKSLQLPETCTALDIDSYYEGIVKANHTAANIALPFSTFNKHAKPYWTSEVKAAHADQRQKRIEWIHKGRPRDKTDCFYKNYKLSKQKFRKAQKDAIANVETTYFSELETSADCDIRYFWHLVNKRRVTKRTAVNELKVNGSTVKSPEGIAESFADFFSNIFTPSCNPKYDEDFRKEIESKVHNIRNTPRSDDEHDDLTCPVELQELINATRELKRRRSPGCDDVVNEHIIYGGPALFQSLKLLFDQMLNIEYIPAKFKYGIVIPICKPGKRKDQAESYRPITLLSNIYKLFEKNWHMRLQSWCARNNKMFPNPQQNAYQKNLVSLTASFNLQELIAHTLELGSECFVVFLDTSKAFDTVWHAGLFSKLHDFGIRGKALRIIMNSYEGMSSYVQVNGMKSRPFQVIQGVRQGGVTSTWYYLLYIDDLLRELDSLEGGCTIGSLRTSNPTLADDFLYSSLTKTGAEKGLKVADNHANRWHYTHHPAKCKLLVFSLVRTPSNATVKLGTSTISQAESVSHVGIEIHKSFKSSAAINARIAKGRSSLFSILSIDRETSLINPITIASLFEKVCLPSVLYGSELWHNMTAEDSLKLEGVMRLAAKSIQKLPM